MEPITTVTSTTIPLMKENIDTDQIIPKQFLKNILKVGYGRNLFFDWRYIGPNKPNPDFILNKPERQGAEILVTGDNFGCGSSREHAVWALKDFGFKVVIAGGYSDIFYMNSTKTGSWRLSCRKINVKSWPPLRPTRKLRSICRIRRSGTRITRSHLRLTPCGRTSSLRGWTTLPLQWGTKIRLKHTKLRFRAITRAICFVINRQ
jgi:3-isopropylmalate dehydratase, small subunit